MPDVDLDDIPANSSSADLDVAQVSEVPAVETTAPAVAAAEPPKAGADGATSSGARGDKDPDLLKIVRDVVDKRQPASAASPAEEAKEDQAEAAPKPLDDENYTDVPFHKHPRFQQVLRKAKTFEVDAKRYQNVQDYLDQNSLSAAEAADGLMIMGLAKTNPVECWKLLQPFAQKVAMAAGALIPPDLQAEIEKGQLTPQTAQRLASERAQRLALEGRQSFEEQRRQRQEQQSYVNSLVEAGSAWEADRTRKDPNFATKLDAITKEVLFLQRTEGVPKTPEGVRAQLDKAYKAVNAALPAPVRQNGARPVTPVRGGQVGGNTRPEPKNTLERIQMIREQSAARA